MCLAIPGKVVETFARDGMQMARVQFGGVTREACLEYVPDTMIGQYVLVHVGFAISRVDEDEAQRTYQALAEGKPVIGLAANTDQFLNMAAVADAHYGILLRAHRATGGEIRGAVVDAVDGVGWARNALSAREALSRYQPSVEFQAILDAGPSASAS